MPEVSASGGVTRKHRDHNPAMQCLMQCCRHPSRMRPVRLPALACSNWPLSCAFSCMHWYAAVCCHHLRPCRGVISAVRAAPVRKPPRWALQGGGGVEQQKAAARAEWLCESWKASAWGCFVCQWHMHQPGTAVSGLQLGPFLVRWCNGHRHILHLEAGCCTACQLGRGGGL